MNLNHDNELEALIDRELKSLPTLSAPASLASHVMSALAAQRRVPWYRAGWQTWPLTLRIASFVVLLALFAGLCLGGGKVWQVVSQSESAEKVNGTFSLLGLIGKTLAALGEAGLQVVRHIGTGYVLAGLALVAIAYAACMAFGSFYFKFAFTRR
jgi:hypothetical protein